METKRVYFIMPNLTGGGAERVASILVNQFAESGVETTLVVSSFQLIFQVTIRILL